MNKMTTYCAIFFLGLFAGTSHLEVDGFTKLGSDAPGIKIMKIEGTTKSIEGDTTRLVHGLSSGQLLMYQVVVNYGVNLGHGESIKENYNDPLYPGYEFYVWNDEDELVVDLSNTNSEKILNAPIVATIIYRE